MFKLTVIWNVKYIAVATSCEWLFWYLEALMNYLLSLILWLDTVMHLQIVPVYLLKTSPQRRLTLATCNLWAGSAGSKWPVSVLVKEKGHRRRERHYTDAKTLIPLMFCSGLCSWNPSPVTCQTLWTILSISCWRWDEGWGFLGPHMRLHKDSQ